MKLSEGGMFIDMVLVVPNWDSSYMYLVLPVYDTSFAVPEGFLAR